MPVTAAPLDMRTGPEASLGEVWSANRTLARGDRSDAETQRLSAAWGPVLDALDLPDSENPAAFNDDVVRGAPLTRWSSVIKGRSGRGSMATRAQQEVALLALIAERKRTNPDFLKDVPTDLDGYRQWVIAREQARRGQAREVLDRSSGATAAIVGFAGGTVETMLDPVNVASLALGGGGRTVAQVALREALIGGVVEGAQQPFVAMNRADIGEELTVGEAAGNVAMGAIGAGVFGGAVKAVELNARPVYERSVSRIIEALPEAAQRRVLARYADPAALDDAALPGVAEAAIGRENMTTDELAAVAVARREAEIDAINPFVPNGAGTRAHRERLGDALAAIVADVPPPRPRSAIEIPARPRVEPGATRAALGDGTAIGSGTVSATPAREALKNRIGVVESGGGRHWANPKSSARGKYQFINGTWLSYYKRRFGDQGLSDAAILAKRADGRLQDQLMDDLLADNAAFLRREGEAETAGHLYLTHFAGQGGARALFRADPNASARSVLGADVIAANPFLAKMTARDVIDWAHAKMGGASPPRSGARVQLAEAPDEAGYRDTLQAELDRLEGERLAAEADTELPSDPRVRFGEALDAEAVPVEAAPIVGRGPLGGAMDALPSGLPVELAQIPAGRITVDAKLMQFKSGGDEYGVTERLQGVTSWNPLLAGRVVVWERADGKLVVADGHQRTGLARRIGDQSGREVSMDAIVIRERDGVSAGEARALGALKNIAEGTGTRIDAAKVFRDAGRETALAMLPPRSALVRDADYLAQLSPRAFDAAAAGVIPEEYAAVVARMLPGDPEGQVGIIDVLAEAQPASRAQAEMIARDAIAAGFIDGVQTDMFGELNVRSSLFAERAKVLEAAIGRLRRMKNAFRIAAREADALEVGGNRIDAARSEAEADGNAVAIELVQRLAVSAGPVKEAIDRAARRLAQGEKLSAVVGDLVTELRGIDLASAARMVDGNGRGAAGAGPEAEAAEEALNLAFDQPELVEAQGRIFDDPAGVGTKAQVDSLEHDVKAELAPATLDLGEAVDPAIAARQRQQVALGADAPMQARVDQESTIGSPLFDAVDQYGMRLDDEGDVINPADLLTELDDEAAAIKAVRDCL